MAADPHRTTITLPLDVWTEVQEELAAEQERRIVPRWLRPAQYAALMIERQLLAQREGRPRLPASKARTGRKPGR